MQIETRKEAFEGSSLDVVTLAGERWVRGPHIAAALGFADPVDAAKKIYQRSQTEFDQSCCVALELPTPAGRRLTRLYNARGAALFAMKAQTPKGEAFRRWVLDVLEGRDDTSPVEAVTGFPPGVLKELQRLFYERKGMIAMLRYLDMGLGTSEISRLLGISAEFINRRRRMAEALGLAKAPANLEAMRAQAGFQKLVAKRDAARAIKQGRVALPAPDATEAGENGNG